jgi:hypothetical protein
VLLYLVSDRILRGIESLRGQRYDNRNLVFFFILLTLGVITFAVLGRLLST